MHLGKLLVYYSNEHTPTPACIDGCMYMDAIHLIGKMKPLICDTKSSPYGRRLKNKMYKKILEYKKVGCIRCQLETFSTRKSAQLSIKIYIIIGQRILVPKSNKQRSETFSERELLYKTCAREHCHQRGFSSTH